ncbi:unnamed protein product [Amoebophrya sp. A25]|nr:unnamed protein product [Amoebophrya sp. A25]|eukprot:GSA25T00009170001.1
MAGISRSLVARRRRRPREAAHEDDDKTRHSSARRRKVIHLRVRGRGKRSWFATCAVSFLQYQCGNVPCTMWQQGAEAAPAPPQPTPERTQLQHPCSRVVSRRVRFEIEKQILQPALKAGYTFPASCAFMNDLYSEQEKFKKRLRTAGKAPYANWECLICGKKFRSEHYIDLHMERVHMEEFATRNSTTNVGAGVKVAKGVAGSARSCSADYCDLFEICPPDHKKTWNAENLLKIASTPSSSSSSSSSAGTTGAADAKSLAEGGDAKTEDDKHKCMHLAAARQQCEDTLLQCFPVAGVDAVFRKMSVELRRKLCAPIDCHARSHKKEEEASRTSGWLLMLGLVWSIRPDVFGS